MTFDAESVHRLNWRIWRREILGSLVGGAIVMVIYALVVPVYPGGVPYVHMLISIAEGGSAMLILGFVIAAVVQRRVSRWAMSFVLEERTPTEEDVSRIAAIPRIGAGTTAVLWATLVPVVLLFVAYRGYDWSPISLSKAMSIFGYCAFIASLLSYLFVEPALRPVLAEILRSTDGGSRQHTMGVGRRLVLAWLAVGGLPLIVIALANLGLTPEQQPKATTALIINCLLVTPIGFFVFTFAGRTITAPLERLRGALRSVAEGDLSTELDIDETGEIGRLQAGFNQMVAGLRERERIRDVFGRHVGIDVARRAMESDFGHGGEPCDATAMFVDIIGSTGLAQRKDPDAVVMILNRFFEAVVRVVGAEGGFVNKFQGDGALCIFGAPVAQPDHAARGLRAARALAIELARLGDIAAAIGVSSGPVVAGNVGAEDRYEFTVIGDPVNEASRLTDEAKLRQARVLVSERTIDAAGAAADGWIRGEAIALRGRAQPTITYSPYD